MKSLPKKGIVVPARRLRGQGAAADALKANAKQKRQELVQKLRDQTPQDMVLDKDDSEFQPANDRPILSMRVNQCKKPYEGAEQERVADASTPQALAIAGKLGGATEVLLPRQMINNQTADRISQQKAMADHYKEKIAAAPVATPYKSSHAQIVYVNKGNASEVINHYVGTAKFGGKGTAHRRMVPLQGQLPWRSYRTE